MVPNRSPARGNARAYALRTQLHQGDWKDAHTFLDGMRDPSTRAFFVEALSAWAGRPDWLDAWCAAKPDSAAPWLVRGAHGLTWAWEARGSGVASTVADDAWPTFVGRLRGAVSDLMTAAEQDPRDPTPWVFRISAAIGLSEDIDTRLAFFAEATRRDPHNYLAHLRMLVGLTWKWGGSHDAMFEFARKASEQASDGSPLHSLIANAHFERCVAYSMEGNQKALAVYLRTAAVRKDIETAWTRSIGSPRHVPSVDDVSLHNLFACMFWQALEPRKAARALKGTGGIVTDSPWQQLGDPQAMFDEAVRETSDRPSADEKLAGTIRQLCGQAIEIGRGEKIVLDYSEAALPKVEPLLAQARLALRQMPEQQRSDVRVRVAMVHGAHVGEILRRKLGGSWVTEIPGEAADGVPWLRIANMYYRPMKTVANLVGPSAEKSMSDVFAGWVEQLTNPSVPPLSDADDARKAAAEPKEPSPGEPAWFERVLLGAAPDRASLLPLLSRDPQLAEEILGWAESALLTAAKKWHTTLDFTPESLTRVEALLGELHNVIAKPAPGETPISPEAVRQTATLWGIYVGEVIRRDVGGSWMMGSMMKDGPESLLMEINGAKIAPTRKVEKRIVDGPGDAIPFYFAALKRHVTKPLGAEDR